MNHIHVLSLVALVGGLLTAHADDARTPARWRAETTDWSRATNLVIGDWGFNRPGYPEGLYIHGVTRPAGEPVTNPVIYDNDVYDDVFDDELAYVMASEGEMNLAGLIVTPVLTDFWGFSKPDWIKTAHESRRHAELSGLRMERIPPITVGTEAPNEKAGENKDSAGARLYVRLINEQYAHDPSRPVIVNIGGQGATLASAYGLDPSIAHKCIVYYTDLRVYNGHYQWASKLIAANFRVVSWGDDNWWITKPAQNQWRVLPRPEKAEGRDNDVNSGEWRQWTELRVPLLDHMVKQFQTRGEYCRGPKKADGYLDGTFLHAWLPGIFSGAALKDIRGGQVLHVTKFTEENESRVKAFANARLLNPRAYRRTGAAALNDYRAELARFRTAHGGTRDLPDVPFFLFGMGHRSKFVYRHGQLLDARSGEVVKEWKLGSATIIPPEYRVEITTADGQGVTIFEDERAVWVEQGNQRQTLPGTLKPVRLPTFGGHPYAQVLRVLHQELLVNMTPAGPVPNLFVYPKPWYRDAAMVALALRETGNLDLIRDWILSLREPFDRNNSGEMEADNLGQVLFLVSLVSDTNHPVVARVLAELPRFEQYAPEGRFIRGRTDFAEHPVYQTKWLKFGLRALGLPDPYVVPAVPDSYGALFWMDYRDQYTPGKEADDRNKYPYLGWACDHFHGVRKSPISNRDYPLTWEREASQADYAGIRRVAPEYVNLKLAAPHTWHGAEVLLHALHNLPAAHKAAAPLPRLLPSGNRRFLAATDGKPFFWLADTAWQLIHDLNEAEMRRYFADRRDKGFNVIQTVVLSEHRYDQPNAFGHRPIEPRRPDRPIVQDGPDNDYWDDVERVLRLAEEHGLYVGLLPTWGRYVTSDWQNGLVDGFFTVANAEAYGRFIGERFKNHANLIWILGGDRAAPTDAARAIWRAMARGIAIGATGAEDYSKVLMTYHTSGPGSTAWFLNDEPWLDVHALQSGHGRWALNWIMVEHAYTMKPTLPVIDLESSYPGFRHGRPPTIATDDDARRAAYWAVFAGAAGHTYGHHSIWQMHSPKYPGIAGPKEYWYDALDAPSARQMGYLRKLIESQPFLTQRPDPSLLAFEQTKPWEMCLALRGDGYALIYTPTGRTLDVHLGKIPGAQVRASWFNPRTGTMEAIGVFENQGRRVFDPPGDEQPGNDWVLVITPLSPGHPPPHP